VSAEPETGRTDVGRASLDRLPRALLVDLDDTIVSDSLRAESNWRTAVEEAAAGQDLPDGAAEAILAAIETERRWFWADPDRHRDGRRDLVAARRVIVGAALVRAGIGGEDLRESIVTAYTARTEADRALLPGATEALREIRELGIAMALVTNGSAEAQLAKIERFGLAGFFEAVVIEGVFGAGKPDESVYRHALACLGVAPKDAAMVGDNLEWDVAAPQRLGLRGIWVDPAAAGLPEAIATRPDAIVRGLPELAAMLAGLAAR
jgi:putative hydrolase of the HAD superfamily